jgi:histone H3/H4
MMASTPGSASKSASLQPNTAPKEVLVIASRLKDYINARSEFSTSASVMDVLSDHLRILCERAIDNARADGRKTVMDRDFEFLKKN